MEKCNILGVNISATNMNEVVEYINFNIQNMKNEYICVSNVHTTIMSYEDESYRNIQNNAILALPDGKPLSVECNKRGFEKCARVAGPDLMSELFEGAQQNHLSHYFYGSTEDTLLKLELKLREKYPEIKIAGMYSPPFGDISQSEDDKIVGIINSCNPDIVWVGLGAPKQEIWMSNHRYLINSLMIGVGAGFDYHAENIKRAPKWMQKLSLEWFYRLMQEPKRLFKRYFITNAKYLKLVRKDRKKWKNEQK